MKKILIFTVVLTISMLASFAIAQQQGGQQQQPQNAMSFFITSVGPGDGASLGGLAEADAYCARLANAPGTGNPNASHAGKTWRAYLSTQAQGGQPAVNARDRIGAGPWYNARNQQIARNLSHLH